MDVVSTHVDFFIVVNASLNSELLEKVECFKYLGSKITVSRGIATCEV